MDVSFSRMRLIGGLLAASVLAIANPLITLTQFSAQITPAPKAEAHDRKEAEFPAIIERNALTVSVLARLRRQKEAPPPPRRGVPGGGT